MRKLEELFPAEIVVIGVHSGKYHTERITARIRDASLRLGATHPIVNDRQFRVWRGFAVNAWPTLVAIDPAGYVAGQHAGEFTIDAIAPFVERTIVDAETRGTLRRGAEHFAADSESIAPGALRYPGKVAVDGDRIAIADSGHHRVIVGRLAPDGLAANVDRVIGGGPGFEDGAAPRFRSPQGLLFAHETLFVADAGNHAVRAVDVNTGAVRTVAGTGMQLRSNRDLRNGALSSPWDVARVGDRLYVAMAGSHQLWSLRLDGSDLRPHSGNRHEAIVDGPNLQAVLAQPMGITSVGDQLAFVDAESSAVRLADADPAGKVRTVVGTGLFDFGDADGEGDDVRMQHQQGIARGEDGRFLVADTYNDALKWVDQATRRTTSWVRGLHEPSGVALTLTHAYVADTNAHRIAVVRRGDGEVIELELRGIA